MGADTGTDDWQRFFTAYPDITRFDLLVPDNNGIFRGKRAGRRTLEKIGREGLRLPGSTFALDITGETVDATGLVWEDGDADRVCRPVAGTLRPAPWLGPDVGQVLLSMYEEDGRPFFGDPRHLLSKVLARLASRGLHPRIAVELEFYLIDRERTPEGRPQPPVSPRNGERPLHTQVYSLDDVANFADVLDAIEDACAIQDIETEAAVAEYAPGQYEINLCHRPDALQAADCGVLFKRLVKGVAAEHGLAATFMAKPYQDFAGNGLHVHVSLHDAGGDNVFAGDTVLGSPLLRQAVAGLQAAMGESMALFAPGANSYRRFQPQAYVPLAPSWAINNRTAALRVLGEGASKRIEHRVAGADANIYLVLAAILAGIDHGIADGLDPGPPVTGNAYEKVAPSLPVEWLWALEEFEQGGILGRYFGADYIRLYACIKGAERQRFHARVTTQEYAWYLRNA